MREWTVPGRVCALSCALAMMSAAAVLAGPVRAGGAAAAGGLRGTVQAAAAAATDAGGGSDGTHGGIAAPEPAATVSTARLLGADAEPGQWMAVGRTYDEQRFSPLVQINADNVARLKLAWFADFDSNRGQEATPLYIDGVLYLSTAWSRVKAFDARTGRPLWAFDPKVPGQFAGHGCCDVVNRGIAAWNGLLYVAAYDGRLIALDAKTGAVRWSTLTLDQGLPVTSTGAPRVINGKVVIGNAGGEFGVRGYLSAYDARNGRFLWRFYTVPGNPAKGFESPVLRRAAKTWSGNWWRWGGGGTVWDGMVYDPDLNLLYFGTGNGSPWNRRFRGNGGGDNLFVASIIAVNPDTGAYVWHYQETPGEEWDYDATPPMMLATLHIGGARRVLMQASKNGFFYVLDAATGRLISARNFVPVTWASGIDPRTGRPHVNPAARYDLSDRAAIVQPGGQGAHSWHPFSYSPKTGLVYFSAIDTSMAVKSAATFSTTLMAGKTGIAFAPPTVYQDLKSNAPRTAVSRLIAWDPVHQREVWHTAPLGTIGGGTLATAGDLVFQGTNKGRFVAYRASDGTQLWSTDAQTGVVAAGASYAVDGRQYIAVEAGYGLVRFGQSNKSRLLVFTLDGTASLPPAPPPPPPPVLDPPPSTAPKRVIDAGHQVFANNCATCHDTQYANRSVFPDLRYSPAIASPEALKAIVLGGALQQGGMASFKGRITPVQLESIRAYLIEWANQLKAAPPGQRR
ncbi:MAG TPA: PQQ-dependent dehydrogenase, methanol/ethanol family [Steroidobacteraceae bacterium]|nr:PQQ-dependent dehydrogenase, methanol/ethanol family [Steroidobacteraceae bacterium]